MKNNKKVQWKRVKHVIWVEKITKIRWKSQHFLRNRLEDLLLFITRKAPKKSRKMVEIDLKTGLIVVKIGRKKGRKSLAIKYSSTYLWLIAQTMIKPLILRILSIDFLIGLELPNKHWTFCGGKHDLCIHCYWVALFHILVAPFLAWVFEKLIFMWYQK